MSSTTLSTTYENAFSILKQSKRCANGTQPSTMSIADPLYYTILLTNRPEPPFHDPCLETSAPSDSVSSAEAVTFSALYLKLVHKPSSLQLVLQRTSTDSNTYPCPSATLNHFIQHHVHPYQNLFQIITPVLRSDITCSLLVSTWARPVSSLYISVSTSSCTTSSTSLTSMVSKLCSTTQTRCSCYWECSGNLVHTVANCFEIN